MKLPCDAHGSAVHHWFRLCLNEQCCVGWCQGRKSHVRIHEDANGSIYTVGITTRIVQSVLDVSCFVFASLLLFSSVRCSTDGLPAFTVSCHKLVEIVSLLLKLYGGQMFVLSFSSW